MLARAAKSDGEYSKVVTLFTTLVLVMSGLVLSPAHATVPSNGTYLCTSGEASVESPNFTISSGVVNFSDQCAGAVVIPAGVTSIGDWAFVYSALTSITIPASVTSIGASAFESATSLTSVYFLGNAPTSVGVGAFYEVASGAKAYIKSGVTGFGTAGAGWYGLVVDIFAPDGAYVCTTGVIKTTETTPTFSIFSGSVFLGEFCSGAVVIPLGVTGIGDYAFFMATSLTSITIPASVTSIGPSAFNGAIRLTSVYFLGNAPNAVVDDPLDQDSFDGVASGAKAYIKSGVTGFGTTGRWAGLVVTTGEKASASVKPTVSGTAKMSKTLTAKKGTWTGYPTPALTYQWYACTTKVTAAKATVPSTCKKITGATKSTLKLLAAQKGKFISVLVTGKGTGTSATKWLSKSTTIVK